MKTLLFCLGTLILGSCGSGLTEGSSSGVNFESNKKLSTYLTDMCTGIADESCIFTGGQVIKFSDGTVLINGNFQYNFSIAGDTDINEKAVTLIFPSSQDKAYGVLSQYVHRGLGYYRLFLAYSRTPETIMLVHDSNNNGVWDTVTDTILTELTVSDW